MIEKKEPKEEIKKEESGLQKFLEDEEQKMVERMLQTELGSANL